MATPNFKKGQQHQSTLFPPALEDLIPSNHPVRVVNEVLDQIDIRPLLRKYKLKGASSYHPRMMLKVLVYSYLCNIFSSRRMEAALKENVHFMWLGGMQKPDHNTLNRFRGKRLSGVIKPIFGKVVELLVKSGHVSLKSVYTDGTKIEANANRYTFVWGRAIKTSKERIAKQLEELWDYAEQVAAEEFKDKRPENFDPVNGEQIRETIQQINEVLNKEENKKKVPAKIRQKAKYAQKNWPDKVDKYNDQEAQLGDRNSMSKTDPDATFMRMKEDYMKNGQLKPGYNLQFSTYDQFILHYTLHQTSTDTVTLEDHLEDFKYIHQTLPEEFTADAGYGSEQNLEWLEQNGIDWYVKFNTFDKEQKLRKKYPFRVEFLHYNLEKDCYYCPMGQQMKKVGEGTRKTATGYQQSLTYYQAKNCEGCPLRSQCFKGKGNRRIQVSHKLNELKRKAREKLNSEKGIKHRKKRPVDVEPVFGNIKHNKKFRRYNVRGMAKVEVETGLLAIAHNLSKKAG